MADANINSFSDLHEAIQNYNDNTMIYRGVENPAYELVPDIGRYEKFDASNIEKGERTILRLFKEQSLPYLTFRPQTEWEWMALARQHGLPTRLLDWTRNPLVAAYFAVEKQFDGDSLIYAYHNEKLIKTGDYPDPFKREEVGKFVPPHVTRRIAAQVAIFTIHPRPKEPLGSPDIDRLVIKRHFRRKLKHILYRYGIHRASLFPDLDGLAAHIRWMRTDTY